MRMVLVIYFKHYCNASMEFRWSVTGTSIKWRKLVLKQESWSVLKPGFCPEMWK